MSAELKRGERDFLVIPQRQAVCGSEIPFDVLSDGRIAWPAKLDLLGVPVSCTDYDQAVASVVAAAQRGSPGLVTAFAAHGVVIASEDPNFRRQMSDFDLITPDGQAVRLALDFLYRAGMQDRVCGPELLLRTCQRAEELGVSVYLYGSTNETVRKLRAALVGRFPHLRVVGCEASVFRPLTIGEDAELVGRVNRSGAGIVFLGLGCPLQEKFAHEHRSSIRGVKVCVGAAFDFVAGTKRRAPRWMQDYALEWLFRLSQEPSRLFRRNAVHSPKFVAKVSLQALGIEPAQRRTL